MDAKQRLSLEINGQKIAYRKFGTGSPIIFANRFRGTLDTWDPLFLELLSRNNTLVMFDYPGIGYSEGTLPTEIRVNASYVTQIATALNIDKYAVLGWSYGGIVAQYAAFMDPQRVTHAVIIGSNPMGKNKHPIEPLFLEKAFIPEYTIEDEITLFFEPASEKSRDAAKRSHDRIAPQLDFSKVPKDKETLMRYFAASNQVEKDEENYRDAYKDTEIKFLALSGDHDISFAVENWFPLVGKAPTLQQIILPDTGHAPHFQYPELSATYISNFLHS